MSSARMRSRSLTVFVVVVHALQSILIASIAFEIQFSSCYSNLPTSTFFISFIPLKSGVWSQLWLIGLGVLLPGLEAHVYVAGKQP